MPSSMATLAHPPYDLNSLLCAICAVPTATQTPTVVQALISAGIVHNKLNQSPFNFKSTSFDQGRLALPSKTTLNLRFANDWKLNHRIQADYSPPFGTKLLLHLTFSPVQETSSMFPLHPTEHRHCQDHVASSPITLASSGKGLTSPTGFPFISRHQSTNLPYTYSAQQYGEPLENHHSSLCTEQQFGIFFWTKDILLLFTFAK